MLVFFGLPSRERPGSRLLFLSRQEKLSKRRRPRDPGPCGVPSDALQKMGGSQTRCAQTCAPLIHFLQHITGPARSGSDQKRSLRIALLAQYCGLAVMVDRYRKKNLRTMSADSAMRSEPFIKSASAPGTPQGRCSSGHLSLLTYLWARPKKVSGCRAAPGKLVRRKHSISNQESQESQESIFLTERHYTARWLFY